MKKILAPLIALLFVCSAYADEFSDFLSGQNKEFAGEKASFAEYQKQIDKEFATYKAIAEQEFADFKKKIGAVWKKTEVSTPTRWVEYSADMKTRRIVDFETGEIRIEIIGKPGATGIGGEVIRQANDLIGETRRTAYERDTLANNIEKRLKKETKNVRGDVVDSDSIVAKLFTGKETPESADVSKAAGELVRRGELTQEPAKDPGMTVYVLKSTLPDKPMTERAVQFSDAVSRYGKERQVDQALIYAVMHTESSFNPMARSHAPAYGLMQIVPTSAGKDASTLLFGKPELLAPSWLYNADNNISAGAAYIYILYYKYLNGVTDPTSRIYCTIAAYNTGTGNVARAFVGTTKMRDALPVINSMTPDQVYETLRAKLPYDETRQYIKRVTERVGGYRPLAK